MLFSDGDRVAGAVPPAFVRGGANVFTFDDHEWSPVERSLQSGAQGAGAP